MTSHTAPEGGYGWIVVAVTFFSYTMMGLLMASFPVMYKEYMYAFDSSAVIVGTVLSYHVIFTDIADMTSHTAPEGGYGWIVVAVTFFSYTMMGLLMASFPVMYKEYMYAFDSSAVLVGTVLSIHVIFTDIAGFLFSGFLRHLDLRVVACCASLLSALSCFLASFSNNIAMLSVCYALSGAGSGVTYISVSPVVHQYFHKKRTLVSGITIAGVSLGTFTFPPLARFSVDYLGWRGTVRIFAALLMQSVWLSALQRPLLSATMNPTTNNTIQSTKWYNKCSKYVRSLVDFSILKHPGYLLFFLSTLCTSLGCTGFLMHITNKCLSEGIDPYRAALAPSINGIVNLIWRPSFGLVATQPLLRKNTCVLYGVAGVWMGIAIALVAITHTFTQTVLAVIPVSIGLATLAIMFQPALVELISLENMTGALSMLVLAMGSGQFIASPLAAWLFEASGSYTLPYIVMGISSIFGGLAALLIGPVSRRFRYRSSSDSAQPNTTSGTKQCIDETEDDGHLKDRL